jgi:hypothetical protein
MDDRGIFGREETVSTRFRQLILFSRMALQVMRLADLYIEIVATQITRSDIF